MMPLSATAQYYITFTASINESLLQSRSVRTQLLMQRCPDSFSETPEY